MYCVSLKNLLTLIFKARHGDPLLSEWFPETSFLKASFNLYLVTNGFTPKNKILKCLLNKHAMSSRLTNKSTNFKIRILEAVRKLCHWQF